MLLLAVSTFCGEVSTFLALGTSPPKTDEQLSAPLLIFLVPFIAASKTN